MQFEKMDKIKDKSDARMLFFDTSALIKRYVFEPGTRNVNELFESAKGIMISSLTKIETHSTLRRLFNVKILSGEDYKRLEANFMHDFKNFTILSFNPGIEEKAIELIAKYQLKTLDSIRLASCLSCRSEVRSFIVSDGRLGLAAEAEGLEVIDPTVTG
jgi:hypothetical protein